MAVARQSWSSNRVAPIVQQRPQQLINDKFSKCVENFIFFTCELFSVKKIKFSTHYEENKIFYTLGFFLSKKSKKDCNSPSENEKKTFCCYNFLNFQCSNLFLQCSLLVFQFHSGSKTVSQKRSATSRPSASRLCPLSRHIFNHSFNGKQVIRTRKTFSHSKLRKLQQQNTISTFVRLCSSNLGKLQKMLVCDFKGMVQF